MSQNSPHPAYDGSGEFVFICYSHADSDVPARIRQLQESGINVWYDSNIVAGSEWTDVLAQRIQNCSQLVYFLTDNSARSENCRREVLFAQSEGKRILVIQLSDLDLPPGLRLTLHNRQVIYAGRLSDEEYIEKVQEAVRKEAHRVQDNDQPVNIDGTSRNSKRQAVALAALFILVIAASVLVLLQYQSNESSETPPPTLADSAGSDGSVINPLLRQTTYTGRVASARISPDGQFIAYTDNRQVGINIHDLVSGSEIIVQPPETFAQVGNVACGIDSWSPGSEQVLARCTSDVEVVLFTAARTGGSSREFRRLGTQQTRLPVFWAEDEIRYSLVYQNQAQESSREVVKRFWVRNLDSYSQEEIDFQGGPFEYHAIVSIWISPDLSLTLATRHVIDNISRIYRGNLVDFNIDLVYESENRIIQAEHQGDSVFFLWVEGEQTVLSQLDPATTAPPQRLLTGQYSGFSVSNEGRLALIRDVSYSNLWLGTRNSDSQFDFAELTSGTRRHSNPRFSLQGDRLVFNRVQGGTSNIHTIHLDSSQETQLTSFTHSETSRAEWHPGGQLLAISSVNQSDAGIWLVGSNGSSLRMLESSPISPESLWISWASPTQLLFQLPGHRTHRFLDVRSGDEAPLFETYELLDTHIVPDQENPAVGWNFFPRVSPVDGRIALFWNMTPGRGLWVFEKGLNDVAPVQLSGQPGTFALFQTVDVEQFAGSRVRLSLTARFQPVRQDNGQIAWGFPYAGLRIVTATDPERVGAYMADQVTLNHIQQVRSSQWQEFTVENRIPDTGGLLRVSCGLSGEGVFACDDLSLSVEVSPDNWQPLALANADFESVVEDGFPAGWRTHNRPLGQHQFELVSESQRGNVLEISSNPVTNSYQDWRPVRWSTEGEFLYVSDREGDLWRYSFEADEFTRITDLAMQDTNVTHLDISADGERIVFVRQTSQSDIWVAELQP